ncbi:hypothetical protein [Paenibacillus mendelii]|uniref:DNA mismatch repair protein n=1 Tax=Paenibacillus mendelii TaxID=206163 RepID=A0ABV6JAG8_9BACL|nr:hypothetical protein [Paenibacillus mendelii]
MSGFTLQDQSTLHSHVRSELPHTVSRQAIIDTGMHYLNAIGTDPICSVCIHSGGSCCNGCSHLASGSGCQLRNTSCTAWLCGFLKYVLYETRSLKHWYEYWDQVPGQDYRTDTTPDYVFLEKILYMPNLNELCEALAADLKELVRTHPAIGFIFTLREKLDKNIDRYMDSNGDPAIEKNSKRNIKILSSHFHHFHRALNEFRRQQS